MNWKGFGRNLYWSSRGVIQELTKSLSEDIQCSGRDSKGTPPDTRLEFCFYITPLQQAKYVKISRMLTELLTIASFMPHRFSREFQK
jgi:hypothetical protein